MLNWQASILPPTATLLEVMNNLNETGTRIVNIVGEDGRLLGIITDGDLRRGLIKGYGLSATAQNVMFRDFISASEKNSDTELAAIMNRKGLLQIPVLDEAGCLVCVKFLSEIIALGRRENWVFIMAGGLGARLRPLTLDTPKPLLPVGGKPVIETVIQNFINSGFVNFYISVNYLADKIKNYLGDGSRYGVKIKYLHEDGPLGTAGSLALLPKIPRLPMLVMNADVLTKLNFEAMLDFHTLNKSVATMGVRNYRQEVPYGVIKTNGNRLVEIVEKPVQHYFVNAGVYVLSPEVIDFIPPNAGKLDMPELFEQVIGRNLAATAYPISEYWLDIGRPEDLEKANAEYGKIFEDAVYS